MKKKTIHHALPCKSPATSPYFQEHVPRTRGQPEILMGSGNAAASMCPIPWMILCPATANCSPPPMGTMPCGFSVSLHMLFLCPGIPAFPFSSQLCQLVPQDSTYVPPSLWILPNHDPYTSRVRSTLLCLCKDLSGKESTSPVMSTLKYPCWHALNLWVRKMMHSLEVGLSAAAQGLTAKAPGSLPAGILN